MFQFFDELVEVQMRAMRNERVSSRVNACAKMQNKK